MKQLALCVTCFDCKCSAKSHLGVRSEEFKREGAQHCGRQLAGPCQALGGSSWAGLDFKQDNVFTDTIFLFEPLLFSLCYHAGMVSL